VADLLTYLTPIRYPARTPKGQVVGQCAHKYLKDLAPRRRTPPSFLRKSRDVPGALI
jgi:hypothetical protein